MHALNQIAQHAAGIFEKIPGYRAQIHEVHHIHNKDAPSGTAITLHQHAVQGGWSQALPIESKREGEEVGLHALAWDSVHDAVVLQHEAKSRLGFAEGTVWALRWTWQRHLERDFGLYTMTDLFQTAFFPGSCCCWPLCFSSSRCLTDQATQPDGQAWQGAVPGLHFCVVEAH